MNPNILKNDESRLVYQMLQKVLYLALDEEKRKSRGVNLLKENNRVTLTICTCEDGSKIVVCMIIGKANRPNDFFLAEKSNKAEKLYKF